MRPQSERVASFHKEFDRITSKYEIGHTLLIFELKHPDGTVTIANLSNMELGGCQGIYAMERVDNNHCIECYVAKEEHANAGHPFRALPPIFRAEEMIWEILAHILSNGFPTVPVGKDVVVEGNGNFIEVESFIDFIEKKHKEHKDKDKKSTA